MAKGNTFVAQGVIATITNDTYIERALPTGLTGNDNTAFRIKEFIFEHPILGTGNGNRSEVHIARGTKVGIALYSDTSLLVKDSRTMTLTTSGAVVQQPIVDVSPLGDIIIVESQIFLGFKTTAFAGLASLGYKIIFEEIGIATDVRIAILAQRLP